MNAVAAHQIVRVGPTDHANAIQQRRYLRIELMGWAIVAAVAVIAFTLLVEFTDIAPAVVVLGIIVALDLPICMDIFWHGSRKGS